MRIELMVTVRGTVRTVHWIDGELSGDDEVRRRLEVLVDEGRVDPDDLLSVIRGVEAATAQRASIVNLDLVDEDPGVDERAEDERAEDGASTAVRAARRLRSVA